MHKIGASSVENFSVLHGGWIPLNSTATVLHVFSGNRKVVSGLCKMVGVMTHGGVLDLRVAGLRVAVGLTIAWSLLCPPFSYLMAPQFLGGPKREWICRVEYDHEYFGVI